jgi:chemotaxis protein MotB
MGSAKVVAAFMADKMTDSAKNVTVSQDGFEFDIPDNLIFERGSSKPKGEFINVMQKLTGVTLGLEDSEIKLTSALFVQLVPEQTQSAAEKVAQERLDLVKNKIAATFEHSTNSIKGAINVKDKKGDVSINRLIGFIRVSIKQKESTDSSKKYRPLSNVFGGKDSTKNVYENFASQSAAQKEANAKSGPAEGFDPNLVNPVDSEILRIDEETKPQKSEE